MTVSEFLKDVRFIDREIQSGSNHYTLIYNDADGYSTYLSVYSRYLHDTDEYEYYTSDIDPMIVTPDSLEKIIFSSGNVLNIREILDHIRFIFKGSRLTNGMNRITEF